MLTKNYAIEDIHRATANIEVMLKASSLILDGVVKADFEQVRQAQVQLEKSRQILEALHKKKLKQDHFDALNYALYARREWT